MKDLFYSRLSLWALALSFLLLAGMAEALAQCSTCVGTRTVRVTGFTIFNCNDGACGDPDPRITLNGNIFGRDNICGYSDIAFWGLPFPGSGIIATTTNGSVTISVSAFEDDSFSVCGGDDFVISTTWNINTTELAYGQIATFFDDDGDGQDYDFIVHYEVLCETNDPSFNDLQLSADAICEAAPGNSTTATVFMDNLFAGQAISFGASPATLPITNPYSVAPLVNLGSNGAATFAGTAQASLTFTNAQLGAAPVCSPVQYTVYAYLTTPGALPGVGSCPPFLVTTLIVYPNPADVPVFVNTNQCVSVISTPCPEFTVSPATYVASPGDAAIATFPVTVSSGIGNPCNNAPALVAIPACSQVCPDIHDLQASVANVCGDGVDNADIDLSVATGQQLLGTDITFAYATQLVNNPNNLPGTLTVIGVNPVSLIGGQYLARVNDVALPNNQTCAPITYIVYAFVTNAAATGAGLPADCRPFASTSVTVYPDPSFITVTPVLSTNGLSCTYTLLPQQCPGFFVYHSTYTASPGDPATNITVLVTNSSDSPCALSVTPVVVNIPACNACEIGFDLPDTYCAANGNLNLAAYTSFAAGTWALVSGAGSVVGNTYNPAGVAGSSFVHITFTPNAGTQCGVTVVNQFMQVYAPVSATLQNTPGDLCMFTNTPFDLSTLYGPGTTPGGNWTVIGPDGANPFPIGSTNFESVVAGWYSLIYTVTNGTCTDSDNFQTYVHPSLNADINDVTICESPSGTVNLSAMMNPNTIQGFNLDGTTPGGLWAYQALGSNIPLTNVQISNNVLTYTIPPDLTAPYTIAVSYTVNGLPGAPAPCNTDSDIAVITITGATQTGFDLPDSWCADGTLDLNNYTALGGGVWTLQTVGAGNIVGNTYLPAANFTGLIQINYQPAAGGCGSPSTQFMQVYAPVSATLQNTPGDLCIFTNTPFSLSTLYGPGTTPGGNWTVIGPDGANPFPIGSTNFEPTVAGWYSLIYTVTNGTCTDSDNFQTYVHPSLNADINDVTICESPSGTVNLSAMMNPNTIQGFNLDGTTPGGLWAYEALGSNIPLANVQINNNVLTYTIPSGLTAPYTIAVSYTVNGLPGAPAPCNTDSDIAVITITGATETGFDLPDSWCAGNGNINLANYTVSGGGTWYITSENSVPTVPPSGIEVPGGIINVNTLGYTNPPTGVGLSGSSVLTVFYQPAPGGCGSPKTETITVFEGVNATLDPVATNLNDEFCLGTVNPLPFDLTILYNATTTTGGVWTSLGPDVTAVSGTTFNPSLPGTYVVTYTVTNGTCSDSDSYTVIVYPVINPTINDLEVCESPSGTIDLTGLLTPTTTTGGTWSINGSSGIASIGFSPSGNTLIYTIAPAANPPYTIDIRYTVTGGINVIPCATDFDDAIITIIAATETGFDLPDTWCAADGEFDLNTYTNAGGGVWTVVSVNGFTGAPLPYQVSGPGAVVNIPVIGAIAGWAADPLANFAVVDIHYQPAAGGCGIPITEVITIYEDVDPSWTNPTPVCAADLPLNLNALVTGTLGGVFSGAGVYLDHNGTPADPSDDFWAWNPVAAGLIIPGSYAITYTVGFEPCEESETHEVAIYPILTDVLNSPVEVCESPSGTVSLSAFLTPNLPANGTWTIVSHNLAIAPTISFNVLSYLISPADVGPYIINLTYDLFNPDIFPEGTPCNPDDLVGQIIIYPASEVGFDLPSTWCIADGPIDLTQYTATLPPTAGGVWSLATNPEVSIGTTYTPQNGDGLVGILYTPGPGGCGMPHVEYIEFLDDVDPFWLNPVVLCQADLPYQLEFATPGGTWTGPGVNPITGQFGIDPQVYVIDFGSGVVVQTQPGNPNRIYSYQEDGMNISAIGGGSPTNFFEFMQIGYQTDIVLTNGTSNGVRFDRGGAIFELLYIQLDAQPLSGGFVVTGYDAANNVVGTVVVPDNTPGGSAIVMPPAFYGIAYFTVVNQFPSIRTRIEEIAFNDLTPILPPGYYTVTYTVGEQPCEESETHVIQVVPTRSTDIRNMTVCQSPSGTVDLTSMIQPGITTPGGIFTVVSSNLAIPPTISNNTLSYQIAFADVPPYTINIQYSLDPILNVFNPGPCNPAPDIAILTITDATETGFDLPDSWCVANGAIYLPNFTTLGGGTYSLIDNPLTPFNESEIPLTGDVFIPYNGAGLVGITYTPIPNGCGSPSTEYIQVLDDWDVVIAPAGPFCPGDAPVNLSVNVITPIPYPQGTVQTYLPGATVVIPAGTTIQVNCGDPADVCFVPITNVANGITINYNNGTTIPYPAGATVSFPDGATVTYLVSPVQTQFTTVTSGTTGQLNAADPVASRPSGTGFVCNNVAGNYRYDTFTFQVSTPGNYVFISNFGAGDGYAYVTQVPYIPGDCGSGVFVAKDDNSGPGLNPQFGTGSGNSGPALFLQPGITYQLITTSVAPNATLNYSWVFSGPGNILTQTVPVGEWSGPGIVNEDTGLFSPIVAGLGTHVITYTTYNGSCVNEESITIFVGDATPPTFTFCPDDIQTTTVSCSAFVNVPNPTATDNCPGILSIGFVATHPVYGTITSGTITNANQASGIYPAGFTTIVWTVTDVAGNTATCDTEIRVIDSANPVIFCQQALSITGYTDVNSCGTFMELATPVAYDNCGLDQMSYVAVHITDANGAPIDTDPNTPGNQPDTIYNDSMPALINGGSNTTPIASNVYPGGVTVVTWTVTDLSGRTATCSVTVNVIDNVAPILINCPSNITENTYPGLCAAIVTWVPPMAIDNCSADVDPALIDALILAHQALEEAEDVLDAATDAATAADNALAQAQAICGNVPTIACQTLINIATADSVATHNVLAIVSVIYQNALNAYFAAQQALEAAAAAATITITSTHQPGDIFQLGNTTVVYTATDGAGNTSTCSFVVTVIDEELPTLTCPPNVTANSIPTHCYGNAFVGFPTNLQDNCGINQLPTNSINFGFNASGNYPVGTTTVVWSIEDINGNVGTCSMTVTIVDVEPPTITFCPEDTTLPLPLSQFYDYYTVTAPGVCEANITIAPLQAWDNCGIASIVNDFTGTDNASGTYPQGQTIVTWTVTDIWNNTSTCATVVFVHDDQAPTITCPAPVAVCTADCTNNATGQYVEPPLPTFTDNCSIIVVANSFTNIAGGSALFPNGFIFSGNGTYPIGTTTIVWTVQDVGGNTNSCATSVTVTKCCQAEAGTLTLSGAQCPTDQLVATATGFTTTPTAGCANTADTYSQWYLVVDNATGLIAALNTTGVFDALGATGLPSGNYTVYAYNSGANNPPSVTPDLGVAIADIINDAVGCFDLSNAVGVFIPDAFPDEPLIGSIYQGTGIVPTFFNVVQIQVSGGTQPYSYNWTGLVGYVQHSVNQNPNGGVLITVVYADNAQWNLQVFDANGCTETSLQFDNLPDTANPSILLDIYNYTIASATANSLTPNGAITIYVEGGTPCGTGTDQYQYNWSGPSNWTNPFSGPVSGGSMFNLTDLVAGWYIVEVTDCNGQSTTGWYWVPKQVRGRGKLADNQLLTAYPNPFTQQTTIEFTVTQTEAATLSVIAMDGKEVATLFKGEAAADELYSVTFDADNLPAGMYIVQLNTASGTTERYKIMLNK